MGHTDCDSDDVASSRLAARGQLSSPLRRRSRARGKITPVVQVKRPYLLCVAASPVFPPVDLKERGLDDGLRSCPRSSRFESRKVTRRSRKEKQPRPKSFSGGGTRCWGGTVTAREFSGKTD